MTREFLQQGIDKAQNSDYIAAIEQFTKAIAQNANSTEAYYRRGLAYYDLGDLEKAIADYDRSLNLDARQVEVYLCRATAFFAAGNFQSSIIDLQVIFNLDPRCDRAYKLRAKICTHLGEYDAAIEYLKQAGKIYLERQDKESCRLCIARIRQLEQQKVAARGGVTNDAFLNQVRQKINQGNLGEAFRDCNWLLQLDPYDPKAYYLRGNIRIDLGDNRGAKQDLYQAAKYFRTQGNITESERIKKLCLQLQLTSIVRPKPPKSETTQLLVRTSQPQNAVQHRLYTLVGNWNIAQGLVERLMLRHPGKPEIWYWEKAIHDLERDRS